MGAGAEDVVDHVAGGAGGPLKQSVGLAIRPAGDGIDKLKHLIDEGGIVVSRRQSCHPPPSRV